MEPNNPESIDAAQEQSQSREGEEAWGGRQLDRIVRAAITHDVLQVRASCVCEFYGANVHFMPTRCSCALTGSLIACKHAHKCRLDNGCAGLQLRHLLPYILFYCRKKCRHCGTRRGVGPASLRYVFLRIRARHALP